MKILIPLLLIASVASAQKKSAVAIRDSTISAKKDEQIQRLEKENAKKGALDAMRVPLLLARIRELEDELVKCKGATTYRIIDTLKYPNIVSRQGVGFGVSLPGN